MKKIMAGVLVCLLLLTGCSSKSGKEFKDIYESLNGTKTSSGKDIRSVTIDEDNPYEKVDASKIVDLMNKKQTFYVYFGFPECPWCRSVIEESIKVAKSNSIKKIYYVDVLDIRDKMEVKEGKATQTKEGTEDYNKLLELLDPVLSNYSLKDSNGKEIATNEKRIYAPNFVYVEKGEAKKLTEATSDQFTDPYMELTPEILEDEEKLFNDFFNN